MDVNTINREDVPDYVPEDVLTDFRNFLYLCWKHLNLPEPTRAQYELAYALQHGPNRMIIEAFRGIGKSWITSALVCWLLLRNPQLKILVVSAGKDRAHMFSTFTLRLLREMPILQHLAPTAEQRSSTKSFDVAPSNNAHAPSVWSVGIFGQLTGSRANVIIFDDIEVKNNSDTPGRREKLLDRSKEFAAVLSPGGRVIGLGTPQSMESVYAVFEERNYSIRIIPAEYPDKALIEFYGEKLMGYLLLDLETSGALPGQPTDPKRFNEYELESRRLEYGAADYALQFMLDTRQSDALKYPMRLADLVVMPLNQALAPEKVVWSRSNDLALENVPLVGFTGDRYYSPAAKQGEFVPYQGAVMSIDPSGRGADETTYAVVKHLNGQLYLTKAGGILSDSGYSEETLTQLAEIAKAQKVNKIVVEDNFGDGMFTVLFSSILNKIYPCSIEEIKHRTQKEVRIIDTLEPVLNQHRLIVDENIIHEDYHSTTGRGLDNETCYRLFYQLTHITREKGCLKHDDRLDALAIAVKYWLDILKQDVDKAAKKSEQNRKTARRKHRIEFQVNGNKIRMKQPQSTNFIKGRYIA